MRHRHSLDPTTHTVELDQLRALDNGLAAAAEARSGPSITAAELGMAGVEQRLGPGRDAMADPLPGRARLVRLSYDGPPEYPYVQAHFTDGGSQVVAEMHTEALRALARHLHLHQIWGVEG